MTGCSGLIFFFLGGFLLGKENAMLGFSFNAMYIDPRKSFNGTEAHTLELVVVAL